MAGSPGPNDPYNVPLGLAVPPNNPHAISVSLPKWQDNVDYEKGEERVAGAMVSGYPRFFIHLTIQKLANHCEQKLGMPNERCMLFPTKAIAEHCRAFIQDHSARQGNAVYPRLVQYTIRAEDTASDTHISPESVDLFIVIYKDNTASLAKQFWQHSGMGISSRLAAHCILILQTKSDSPKQSQFSVKASHRHYGSKDSRTLSPTQNSISSTPSLDDLTSEHDSYLEERYGRNLPITAATNAKRALRRRIAGVLVRDNTDDQGEPYAGTNEAILGPSSRGIAEVTEDDVYLYPCGMAAIWNAHQLCLAVRPPANSICFGFPYTDTLKILQKWGPGCDFFGHGLDSDIIALESLLEERVQSGVKHPALALFTEFPSNPLLRSADLVRLRELADKYEFLLVIDETIGNFLNVSVFEYADIMVSSLSKIFSGSANVMGGSLILNPKGRHYKTLKNHMESTYTDFYFNQDAIFMERNSRDFEKRIPIIDQNTESICDFLRSHSIAGTADTSPVIQDVLYPKWQTASHYERHRIKGLKEGDKGGGYGGLFSITFTSEEAAVAFFDALPCYKGPSLGTNFTLACPFVILAHFLELDWAAKYGVDSNLVRVSVGMEDRETLLSFFQTALDAAKAAVRKSE